MKPKCNVRKNNPPQPTPRRPLPERDRFPFRLSCGSLVLLQKKNEEKQAARGTFSSSLGRRALSSLSHSLLSPLSVSLSLSLSEGVSVRFL